MTRVPHKALQLKLTALLGVKVLIRARVDQAGSIIVILDVPEITPQLERLVKSNTPTYLNASIWTYKSLRDAAHNPDSPLETLLVAAHVLPRSVSGNPVLEWIALENPIIAERLWELL